MDYHAFLEARLPEPLTAVLVGVGEFGASFVFRGTRSPYLRVAGAADSDPSRAVRAARSAGIDAARIARCDSRSAAIAAWERGDFVVSEDAAVLCELPVDFVVEATGAPEAAAAIADTARRSGRNVAMVSKECDSVVGAILQAKARAAGLVHTAVDGDQPSLATGLVTWARSLGLDVVCAGKASEFDFVYSPVQRTVTAGDQRFDAAFLEACWKVPAGDLVRAIERRRQALAGWPHSTVPDLCELGIIANATGLTPSTASLHAPIARTLELPDLFRPSDEGGLLGHEGSLDVFNCLRRDDEISGAGGVFVVVRCDDAATWRVLRNKGIPSSADGRYALLHNPVHLLGIEAPMSLWTCLALKQPAARLQPRYDVVARAQARLRAGTRLALGPRHTIASVDPLLVPARPIDDDVPLPYYMAAEQVLCRDVAAGAAITKADVQEPAHSVLWRLRREQDGRFHS